MSQLSEKVIEYAKKEVAKNVREEGGNSNRGQEVEKYQKSIGSHAVGKAWCAAFVYWCFDQAAKELGIPNPLPKTAHVPTFYMRCEPTKKVEPPQKGDVFISHPNHNHMGIVADTPQNGKVTTIEGNTWRVITDQGVFQVSQKTEKCVFFRF